MEEDVVDFEPEQEKSAPTPTAANPAAVMEEGQHSQMDIIQEQPSSSALVISNLTWVRFFPTKHSTSNRSSTLINSNDFCFYSGQPTKM